MFSWTMRTCRTGLYTQTIEWTLSLSSKRIKASAMGSLHIYQWKSGVLSFEKDFGSFLILPRPVIFVRPECKGT